MVIACLGTVIVSALGTTAAMANSPSPTANAESAGSVIVSPNGTVTVTFSGSWLWPFSPTESGAVGLTATITNPCDHRFGAGWGVVWSDPKDSGIPETYASHGMALTVNVGSHRVNPANTDTHVLWNPSAPCGTFVQTNQPSPGDGNVVGTWQVTHVYSSVADLPPAICVITYDLGFGKLPVRSRVDFTNDDNSVAWSLFKNGSWNTTTMGDNCSRLPPPMLAPTVPTPVVTTVSHSVPPPQAPAPVHVATKATSSPLAFTGFGTTGQLLALIGALLLLAGLVFYFVDVRKVALWLLGL